MNVSALFFKFVLAIPGLLNFHINLWIGVSVSAESPAGVQTGIALNLCDLTVRSESLEKPDGRSEQRTAGFISGDKRESGANQGRLGLTHFS